MPRGPPGLEEKTLVRDPGKAHLRPLPARLLCAAWVVFAAAGCFFASAAAAQPFDRPVQEMREETPDFADPGQPELTPPATSMLPALPVAGADQPELQVRVQGFRIAGSTVFSEAQLAAALEPWRGREIGSEDLLAIRNGITQLYVDAGYPNSGALIPDQDLSDGFIEIAIVEGVLTRIDVTGTQHYRPSVLRKRIAGGVHRPLRLQDVELALQQLQQDPRIERISARLSPGERAGEAVLALRVEEARPYRVSLQASNYTPVAFGSYRGSFRLAHENVLGFGDTLETRFRVSGGLFRFGGQYDFPVNRWGTTLLARGEYSSSSIIEDEFETLDSPRW